MEEKSCRPGLMYSDKAVFRIKVLWDVTLCRWASGSWHFYGTTILLNVGNYPHINFNRKHCCCNIKSQKAIFTLSETVISEGEAHRSAPTSTLAAQGTAARKKMCKVLVVEYAVPD